MYTNFAIMLNRRKIMTEYLSVGKAAKYLGKSVHTLQRWDNEGKLPAKRTATNRRVYTKAQLDKFMNKDNEGQFLLEYTRPIKTKQEFVGRTKETNDLLAILAKPSKANVMLTGDAGIGKTALVKKISQIDFSRIYLELELWKVILEHKDFLGAMSALNMIFSQARELSLKKHKEVVLTIDEFHQITLLNGFYGEAFKNLLLNYTDKNLHIIAMTTPSEYDYHFIPSKRLIDVATAELNDVFTRYKLTNDGYEEQLVIKILHNMAVRYKVIGFIKNPDNYFETIYKFTKHFMPDKVQPRASIMVLDTIIGYYSAFKKSINQDLLIRVMSENLSNKVDRQDLVKFAKKLNRKKD